ncbi:hypothetical protein DOY81_001764 [Sarcophaga bullata]|nr:hypothetical protein DOY81_001764 [Sarcophaga bullata]
MACIINTIIIVVVVVIVGIHTYHSGGSGGGIWSTGLWPQNRQLYYTQSSKAKRAGTSKAKFIENRKEKETNLKSKKRKPKV